MSARPPVVVSGLPNMTPIFSRIWLMKIRQVRDFETVPVSLRRACDIRRACRPMWESPISPSSSALGTRAATESTTSTSIAFGADQGFDDFERLFAVVGLRNEQVVDVDAELFGVGGVERVFGVDEGRHAAGLLRFGDDLQGDGGLTGGFRAEDLDDAAAREAAYAERSVEGDGTGRDDRDGHDASFEPSRMMEPLPNCFSSPDRASSIALLRSSATIFLS